MTEDVASSKAVADDPPPLRMAIPAELLDRIEAAARAQGIGGAEFIRLAIERAPARLKVEKEPVMTRLVLRLKAEHQEKAEARSKAAEVSPPAWIRAACELALEED